MAAPEIAHLELCSGYGGIGLGLRRALPALRTVAHVEIEAYAVANLLEKMESGRLDQAPIWTDLKTLPLAPFRGVDVVTAGFPCQPFSAAGERQADEDPRHLWPYILRAVVGIRPSVVLLENVEGIITSKLGGAGWMDPAGTPVLLHVCRELERIGYRPTWGIFSAEEVRASHRRKRVFILAVDDNQGDRFKRIGLSIRPREPRLAATNINGGSPAMADPERQPAAGRRDARDMASEAGGAQGGRDEREWMRDAAIDSGADVADSERSEWITESGTWEGNESADRDRERGGELGDTDGTGSQGRSVSGVRRGDERADWPPGSPEFPPGPGELDRWACILEAAPWLSPALPKCPLRGVANEYSDWFHLLTINEKLCLLFDPAGTQKIQWTPGRYGRFQPKEVLQQAVHGEGNGERGPNEELEPKDDCASTRGFMRAMWRDLYAFDSSQGQELEEQRSVQLADALRFVSYLIAPRERRHCEETSASAMLALREGLESGGVQHVQDEGSPKWERITSFEAEWATIFAAFAAVSRNRVDRLRLCGNGVVPATVARAFRVLSERLKQ